MAARAMLNRQARWLKWDRNRRGNGVPDSGILRLAEQILVDDPTLTKAGLFYRLSFRDGRNVKPERIRQAVEAAWNSRAAREKK